MTIVYMLLEVGLDTKKIKIKEVAYFLNILGNKISRVKILNNNITILLKDSKDIQNFIKFFKINQQFDLIVDIFGIDFLKTKVYNKRFVVKYIIRNILTNNDIHLEVEGSEHIQIPSISSIFKGAIWLEREVWDMFGLYFYDHPDLRRILTDYGFQGFPLRKDFPLSGFIELRYDDSLGRIIYEPVTLSQEYRFFEFKNPWKDEKKLNIKK